MTRLIYITDYSQPTLKEHFLSARRYDFILQKKQFDSFTELIFPSDSILYQ